MCFIVFVFLFCLKLNLFLNQISMNQNSKQTWKRVIDIIITILTALITSLTTTSCIG